VSQPLRLVVRFDGGARGNPGPAAAAAVIEEPGGGVVAEVGEVLGRATNNFAEYKALLLGLAKARELGAREVEVVGDSELVVHQLNGRYQVRSPNIAPLFRDAMTELKRFDRWRARQVPRAENARADRLVNQLLDRAAKDAFTA
jgi:ribonuclease HI